MTKVDQFGSVFRAASKTPFAFDPVEVGSVLVVSDEGEEEAAAFAARVRGLLSVLERGENVRWSAVAGGQFETVPDLLERVESERPGLICTYRHLHSDSWQWPYTLGEYIDVLTQATSTPVLVLPHPKRPPERAITGTSTVVAMTDHLVGDDRLVNWAARFTAEGGRLVLSNVEDLVTFERFMEVVGKIPSIDTENAREHIQERLGRDARDYIASCAKALAREGLPLSVEEIVTQGHHLIEYRRLVEEHDADLLVMNTKDDDQLAMHGLAYPLAIEIRSIPLSAPVSVPVAVQAAEHVTPHVSGPVTALFAVLLVAMIACLALEEKLHAQKSLIVGLYAVVCLLLGAVLLPLPYGPYVIGGHEIAMPVYIPAVDWGVITIILGASLFVDVTSRSGLFTWIAIRLTKASGGDPLRLLWLYGLMTVVFSAVLNNVTAMIIVGSLTAVSLGRLDRNDKLLGFLLVEALLTNIGGLLTLISSVPNIIVGTAADISFLSFFVRASPFVAVATVVTLLMGAKLFGIVGLPDETSRAQARQLVSGFDENDGIESRGFFWFAAAMLVLFIVAIATTSVMPYVSDLGMGFVALAFALIMLVRYKHEVDQFYRTIDWDLLGFFGALFVVINVMEHAQVLALIGVGLERMIDLGPTLGTGAVMVATAFFSAVTDNIPLSAMLAKIIAGIPMADGLVRPPTDPLWWAVIFGANLGGNITPIGSASTLVAVTIIHKQRLHLTFVGFVKKALPFALAQIALAAVYVLWIL